MVGSIIRIIPKEGGGRWQNGTGRQCNKEIPEELAIRVKKKRL